MATRLTNPTNGADRQNQAKHNLVGRGKIGTSLSILGVLYFEGPGRHLPLYALLFRYDGLLLEDDATIIALPGAILRWADAPTNVGETPRPLTVILDFDNGRILTFTAYSCIDIFTNEGQIPLQKSSSTGVCAV